jgi:hypothetical protein
MGSLIKTEKEVTRGSTQALKPFPKFNIVSNKTMQKKKKQSAL